MIEHSASITKLMGALLAVQGKVDGVQKDSANPHFKNRYASLEAVVDAIRDPCQASGLVVMQAPGEFASGAISIATMIAHAESGEWIRSTLQLPVGAKQDPQGAGSAISYGLRYSLMAIFNLPAVDDDGEGARHAPPARIASVASAGNGLLANQLGHSLEETRRDTTPVNAPPYAAELDRIRKACEAMKQPTQYQALMDRSDFLAAYENLPKVAKTQADAILMKTRQRLGIKGESVLA